MHRQIAYGVNEKGQYIGCWICLTTGVFSVFFVFFSWIGRLWFLFERIILTTATAGIVFFYSRDVAYRNPSVINREGAAAEGDRRIQ